MYFLRKSENSTKGFKMPKFGNKLIDAAKFVLAFIIIPQLTVLSLFAIIYTQMTTPEDLAFMQKYEEGAYTYFSMMAELIFLIIFIAGGPLIKYFYRNKTLPTWKYYTILTVMYIVAFIIGTVYTIVM